MKIKQLRQIVYRGRHKFIPRTFVIGVKNTLEFTFSMEGYWNPYNYPSGEILVVPDQVTKVAGISNILSARIKSIRLGIRKAEPYNDRNLFELVAFSEKWWKYNTISLIKFDAASDSIKCTINKKTGWIVAEILGGNNVAEVVKNGVYTGIKIGPIWRLSQAWFGGKYAYPEQEPVVFNIFYSIFNKKRHEN